MVRGSKKMLLEKIIPPTDEDKTSRWMLRGIYGTFKDMQFSLGKTTRIGRNPAAEIIFPPNTAGISRMHCELTVENEQVYIEDLYSTCGTELDYGIFYPIPLSPGERTKLEEGAYICLAPIRGSDPKAYRQILELIRMKNS